MDSIPEAESLPSARLSESRVVLDMVADQLTTIGSCIVRANAQFNNAAVINLTRRTESVELSGVCIMLVIKHLEEKGYVCQLRAEPPDVQLRISWGHSSKKEELDEATSFLAARTVKGSRT